MPDGTSSAKAPFTRSGGKTVYLRANDDFRASTIAAEFPPQQFYAVYGFIIILYSSGVNSFFGKFFPFYKTLSH
jgi:hypothetical protein